jgi:hypothetical protein
MAGNSVLMSSSSGIGKSQMQYQVFTEIKARDAKLGIRWGLGVIFAATQTPPDLIGFQFKGEREYPTETGEMRKVTITDPSVPLWMLSVPHGDDPGGKPAFMYDRFFLIIEEYGQGEADVKRGLAEVFLNGGTAPWYLPEGSIRVASTNQGARYGVTKDFDFCFARRVQIDIQGDVEIWLSDFADKPYRYQGRVWQTMPVTKAWAAVHPDTLFEKEPDKQGPWCHPRSLSSVDRYLQCKASLNDGVIPTDPVTIESIAGTIGMGGAQSIVGHIQFRTELPSYAEVVADPANAPVPTKADLMLLMAYEMAGYTKVEHLAECITYITRLPAKDMQITYISALLRRDYKSIINEPAMQAWINKNASLVSIIASLSQ